MNSPKRSIWAAFTLFGSCFTRRENSCVKQEPKKASAPSRLRSILVVKSKITEQRNRGQSDWTETLIDYLKVKTTMHEKELQLPIYTTFLQNNIIYKKKN